MLSYCLEILKANTNIIYWGPSHDASVSVFIYESTGDDISIDALNPATNCLFLYNVTNKIIVCLISYW